MSVDILFLNKRVIYSHKSKRSSANRRTSFNLIYIFYNLFRNFIKHSRILKYVFQQFKRAAIIMSVHNTFVHYDSVINKLFLNKVALRRNYHLFILSAKRNENRTIDAKWNSNAVTAVKVYRNRWVIEIAIPFADIGVTPGPKIKANFYRNRVLDRKGSVSSCWSPIMTEGHYTPSRFGSLLMEK